MTARRAWNTENGNFKNNLLSDNIRITKYLSQAEIEECFDSGYYLRNIETIYKRLGV
ncbi:MAG: hypothetical protein MZV70_01740 [Desulfobacterales bacterium]|nr:hypothetical protein [Desulfobacterales bacterium]